MILAHSETGNGRPLVVLHGMFGQGRNWNAIARLLQDRYRVFSFDLRNHGASPWSETMTYAEMAQDVSETMLSLGLESAVLLGHSMGGKVAMALALSQPQHVEALIVADIAPVSYPMHNLALVQALQKIDLALFSRRSDVDKALEHTIPDRMICSFLLQNLVVGEGGLSWRLNLHALAQSMPVLSDFPKDMLEETYNGPTLFVAGEKSDYILPEHHSIITRSFPHSRLEVLQDAAHWLHADRPEAFASLVDDFLHSS